TPPPPPVPLSATLHSPHRLQQLPCSRRYPPPARRNPPPPVDTPPPPRYKASPPVHIPPPPVDKASPPVGRYIPGHCSCPFSCSRSCDLRCLRSVVPPAPDHFAHSNPHTKKDADP